VDREVKDVAMAVKSEGNDLQTRYDDYKMEFHWKFSIDPIKQIFSAHYEALTAQTNLCCTYFIETVNMGATTRLSEIRG
jgi:hypothetical protein